MRPVLLIATNYMREQRWVVLSLALYPPAMALLFRGFESTLNAEDLNVFMRQQAAFVVFFGIIFASAAIHNDRRSRRILGILSKAVRRSDYIAGILIGIWISLGAYVGSAALTLAWISPPGFSYYAEHVLLPAFVATMAASATTIFFAVLMHPLFATALSGVALGLPALLQLMRHEVPLLVSPAYFLMQDVTTAPVPHLYAPLVALALGHTVLFWALASLIFSYRDIAVAIE